MLVIGDREVAENTVSVRSRSAGDLGPRAVHDFITAARREVDSKALNAAAPVEKQTA